MTSIDLHPHQIRVREYVACTDARFPLLLFHKMGSGKTIASIAAMRGVQSIVSHRPRVLVLADKTLEGQWRSFIDKHIPTGSVECVVARYQMLSKAGLEPAAFDMVIVDEAHRFRNCFREDDRCASRSREWIDSILNAQRVVMLTGTPVLFDANIEAEALRRIMCVSESNPLEGRVLRYDPEEDDALRKFYPRVVRHPPVRVTMTWSQVLMYCMARRSTFTLSVDGNRVTVITSRRAAYNSMLRSISNCPFPDNVERSPKLRRIIDDVSRSFAEGKRRMVYSSRRELGAGALYNMWKRRSQGTAYLVEGSMSAEKRTNVLQAFNAAGSCVLFVTDCASQGIDLHHVDVVRLTEPHDGVFMEEQIINRAVRFGSHGEGGQVDVFVYTSCFPGAQETCRADESAEFAAELRTQGMLTPREDGGESKLQAFKRALVEQHLGPMHCSVDEATLNKREGQRKALEDTQRWIASMDTQRA